MDKNKIFEKLCREKGYDYEFLGNDVILSTEDYSGFFPSMDEAIKFLKGKVFAPDSILANMS